MPDSFSMENGSLDEAVAEVVDAFRAGVRRGEHPDVEAYAQRHPQLADILRRVLPALDLLRPHDDEPPSPSPEGALAESREGTLSGVLGDFRIVREVGKGGMGVVYEAEQISLRRRVALKVLPFAATMDPRHLQRFHNEAQAAACLHHTNIVPVFSVGCERGVHFYAMQFIDGQPLSELIRQLLVREKKTPTAAGGDPTVPYHPQADAVGTPPPAAELTPLTGEGRRGRDYYRKVAGLGVQAAEALDHAHQLGIVHRDIKPGNLLLDGTGRLWVTDFGLAQVQQSEAKLTIPGQAVGTPRYMSPEQALAQRVPIDHRTDVYSLGATLYELLTLQPAFPSEDRQEVLRQIASEDPVKPRRLERAIPGELEIIVLKAMEKRPQDRYATAQELADDLERWLREEPIRARRPNVVQRLRKWGRRHQSVVWSAVLCSLVIVAVVGASLGWVAGDRAARRAQAADSFDRAVQHAITCMQEEKWPEAHAAAERAAGLLAGAGGDPVQQQRLQQLEADLKMATALELARLEKASVKDGHFDGESAAPIYAAAFRDYNLTVLEMELDEAVRRIAESDIRKQLLAALVDWSNIHPDPAGKKKLVAVLRQADRDPWRRQLWVALDHQDGASLVGLAHSIEALDQPPARLCALGDRLAHFDKPAAVKFLQQAQQRHPEDFWINHQLAFYLAGMEPPHLAEAIGFYRAAVALRPRSPGAHQSLGSALSAKGQLDEAIAEFRQAIRLKKDSAKAHYNLGIALKNKGQLDEAIAEYRQAIRLHKDFAEAHNNLGNALNTKGQLDEAIVEFRQAIRIKKDHAEAHCNLGGAFERKGEFAEALIYLRRGHELGSKNPRWHYPSAQWIRNCERLVELDGKLPAILSCQKQPADMAERLALAQLCQLPCKQRHMAAVRFYREVFAEQPKVAGDLNAQHRYKAACAATLVGCGQGEDADKLDSKERVRLRQQALDWLRADLKAYQLVMQQSSGKAGPAVAQRMQHWLQDKDFAGVRGEEALAQLPEAERVEWRKLWASVAATLAQAEGKALSAKHPGTK